jgi:hypothetical protein
VVQFSTEIYTDTRSYFRYAEEIHVKKLFIITNVAMITILAGNVVFFWIGDGSMHNQFWTGLFFILIALLCVNLLVEKYFDSKGLRIIITLLNGMWAILVAWFFIYSRLTGISELIPGPGVTRSLILLILHATVSVFNGYYQILWKRYR